ncbi:dephospho-CoA kinase [Clostridium sp. BJN0001]|uniref:dephospho-CoA kinase n=1 Tax=Clostridium sp. BJN0001 TaxID=2930219 RepID=UPI001FD2325B|nr:dephospho-CoA kinase [Clostridium sp. BJN0001]
MLKIGLTGGIGTGKSTACAYFRDNGLKVIDADKIAKEVVTNKDILDIIKDKFGCGFFDWRGQFRRKEFGNHIFRFPNERIKYENIVIPYIKSEIKKQFAEYEKNKEDMIILDAPTLIETGFYKEVDYIVLVYTDINTQIQRVRNRDNLSRNDAVNRINSQIPLNEKKKYADMIIDTSDEIPKTQKQLKNLIEFFKLLK